MMRICLFPQCMCRFVEAVSADAWFMYIIQLASIITNIMLMIGSCANAINAVILQQRPEQTDDGEQVFHGQMLCAYLKRCLVSTNYIV